MFNMPVCIVDSPRDAVYTPRQICDKYPEWLATHRESLPTADYQRYGQQYQSFQRVLAVYEVREALLQTPLQKPKPPRFFCSSHPADRKRQQQE